MNKDSFTTTFNLDSIPDAVTLCIDGYGISYTTEVSVHLNGALIGHMNPGGDPTKTCFELTPAQVQVGPNTVLFTQDISGQTWGVGGTSATEIIQVSTFNTASIIPSIFMLLEEEEQN